MTPLPLTRRQHEILRFVEAYISEHGISPTLEEIAASSGVNKVTVFGHVAELERKGVIVRTAKGASRSLRLSDADLGHSRRVSVLGTIAAGLPLEALEVPESLDLTDIVPRGGECFALKVRGNSMIDDGIRSGDLVLVERRVTAGDGDTVVAVLPDGTATLKRYYREKGRVRLQPANPAMEPIFASSVEIRGIVIGLIRRM